MMVDVYAIIDWICVGYVVSSTTVAADPYKWLYHAPKLHWLTYTGGAKIVNSDKYCVVSMRWRQIEFSFWRPRIDTIMTAVG